MKNSLLTHGKRRFIIALAVSILCWSAPTAFAQSSTSPQGAAGIYTGSAVCVASNSGLGSSLQPCTDTANNGLWFTVENASLKTSNTTDLFISPSLVTGLYTETKIHGSNTGSTETAAASEAWR